MTSQVLLNGIPDYTLCEGKPTCHGWRVGLPGVATGGIRDFNKSKE